MGYAAVNSEKKRFRAFMNKNPSKVQVIARIKKIMSGKGEKSALKFEVMKFGLENYFNRGQIVGLEGIRDEMFNLQDNLYLKKNLGFYDIREGEMRGGFDIPQDKIDDFARNTKQYLSPKKKAPKPPTLTPPTAKEKARGKAAKEKAKAKAVKEKARAKAKVVKEKAKAKAAKAKAKAVKEKEKARDKAKANAAKKKAMAKAMAKVKANGEKRMKCFKLFRLAVKQFEKEKNKYTTSRQRWAKCSGLSENKNNA
tara:strand:- start:130 stop:891 length:762 start_codon:yes stop_codon:yes gene_type:complete